MTLAIENVDIALLASFLDQRDWGAAYLDPAGGDIRPGQAGDVVGAGGVCT